MEPFQTGGLVKRVKDTNDEHASLYLGAGGGGGVANLETRMAGRGGNGDCFCATPPCAGCAGYSLCVHGLLLAWARRHGRTRPTEENGFQRVNRTGWDKPHQTGIDSSF